MADWAAVALAGLSALLLLLWRRAAARARGEAEEKERLRRQLYEAWYDLGRPCGGGDSCEHFF